MTASTCPNLGFDPCPGDLAGYEALASYAGRSAATLARAVQTLASAGPGDWRGQAAQAFRGHLDQEVLPLARKASESVGQAAQALRAWAATLSELQQEARALDQQAAPHRTDLNAMLHKAGLPAGGAPPLLPPPTMKPAQCARMDAASTALNGVIAKANDLHARYLAAVQRTGSQLQDAGHMAPQPPGLFASLWHEAVSGWDAMVHGLDEFVHDKALLQFISGVCNVIATVAGLLALFPPLTAIFGPIALVAAIFAMGADALLAGFDGGSWGAVALDGLAVVSDAGWMKAAGKLADLYKGAGLEGSMTKATTWSGLVSKIPKAGSAITGDAAKTVDVAPGMFRMIGNSLKAAATGGTDATAAELSAIKDLDSYGTWRAVDIMAGQGSWAFSGGAVAAVPGTVRTWVSEFAAGNAPWQAAAAGT